MKYNKVSVCRSKTNKTMESKCLSFKTNLKEDINRSLLELYVSPSGGFNELHDGSNLTWTVTNGSNLTWTVTNNTYTIGSNSGRI